MGFIIINGYRFIKKEVPLPSSLLAQILPPMASTWAFVKNKPTPLASLFLWKTLLNPKSLCPFFFRLIPDPLSLNSSCTIPSFILDCTKISGALPSALYFRELLTKLRKILSKYTLLYLTVGASEKSYVMLASVFIISAATISLSLRNTFSNGIFPKNCFAFFLISKDSTKVSNVHVRCLVTDSILSISISLVPESVSVL